jgi:CHAD domain-containing protein
MKKLFIESADIPKEVIRISSAIIDETIQAVNQKETDDDTLVHDLRKSVKKLRALLKLLRKETGEEFFKKNNFALRDLNSRSAAIRNYSALIKLVQMISEHPEETEFLETLNLLLLRLQSDFKEVQRVTTYDTLFKYNQTQLEKYKSHLSNLEINESRFASIKAGITRVYSDGISSFEIAIANPTEKTLHEWRKNVKDLSYCSLTLTPIWKPVLKSFTKELNVLSDMLGELHDFYELTHYIQSLIDNSYDFSNIFILIENKQTHLMDKSFHLGKKIFAESGEQFSERIKAYFRSFKLEQSKK